MCTLLLFVDSNLADLAYFTIEGEEHKEFQLT